MTTEMSFMDFYTAIEARLAEAGYKIDLDMKQIAEAQEEGQSPDQVAQWYMAEYDVD